MTAPSPLTLGVSFLRGFGRYLFVFILIVLFSALYHFFSMMLSWFDYREPLARTLHILSLEVLALALLWFGLKKATKWELPRYVLYVAGALACLYSENVAASHLPSSGLYSYGGGAIGNLREFGEYAQVVLFAAFVWMRNRRGPVVADSN